MPNAGGEQSYSTDDGQSIKLFGSATRLPEGFKYEPDLITADEERELLRHMTELPFRNFEFHGYVSCNTRSSPSTRPVPRSGGTRTRASSGT